MAVTIPPSLLVDFKNGKLEFLKNDDQKQDFTLNFEPNADGVYLIPNAKLQTGSYKVRIQWESNKKSYYREQTVIVP
jgi:nitrogen fixation protein FixH